VSSKEEVALMLKSCTEAGHEGLMLRDPDSCYKFGRATPVGQELVKVKTFEDAEATVIGYEEEMHNANEATVNELGRTKRSSHKANMTGKGRLGALIVLTQEGVTFNVGSGFTDDQRLSLWTNRKVLPGLTITYRYFNSGSKDKPRFPTFVGFRKD
jgi:DNA ligase 1